MSPSSGSRRTPMPPTTFAQGLQNSTALPSDAEESIACGRKGRRAGGFSYWKTACVVLLFCAATTFATASPIYKQLFHFSGTDGANSNSLVQGTDGNLYGTTQSGGANSAGTVFKITPAGALTTLYSFCTAANCSDGALPRNPLIQGADGNFYGTTTFYGANNIGGTVFKITSKGILTTLYSFCGNGCLG